MEAALFTDRHLRAPSGAAGGGPGKVGAAWKVSGKSVSRLGSKTCLELKAGDSLRIATPGGGGWGTPRKKLP